MYPWLIPAMLITVFVAVAFMGSYSIAELAGLAVFLGIIGVLGYQYILGNTVTATWNTEKEKPLLDVAVAEKSDVPSSKPEEVFHVPGQYDYRDAKALCKAYGAKLANITEITQAQMQGAEWCDYGWSKDKMVLFPTQYETWKKLGKNGKCGRPGVNGGIGMNLLQKLGANCFGVKPDKTVDFEPPSIPESEIDARVKYWQERLPPVAPFNYEQWSS
jgi:Extracellular link domain